MQVLHRAATSPLTVRRALLAAFVAGACAIGLLSVGLPEAVSPVGQWDFETYYFALKVYDAGGNPWEMEEVVRAAGGAAHHFIYPHHTFAFFRLFEFDDIRKAKDVYLAARLACLAGLLALWTFGFVRAGARGWFLAFAALGYNAAISRDLVVGNVSIFEQTCIWFGLFALLRGRLGVCCGLVILAGQFKLLPLALLVIILAADAPRKWRYLAGSVAACAVVAVGVYLSNPSAARIFASLTWKVGTMEPGGPINPCGLALLREAAAATLGSMNLPWGLAPVDLANGVYAVLAATAVLLWAWAVRRGMSLRTAILVGVLTYVLLSPRMKDYSYIIAIVPTFELLRERMQKPASAAMVVAAMLLLGMPGLEMLGQYRQLMLAAWAWAIGLSSVLSKPATGLRAHPS